MKRTLPAVLLLALAGEARALDFALNAGAIEVLTVPPARHLAVYPSVGVSAVKAFERVTLIPGLAAEWAPETGAWGLVGSLVADFSVNERLGLDLDVTVLHDQAGAAFGQAAFFAGAGGGGSLFFGKWTASVFVNLFHGLNVEGWSLVPGLNVAYAL